MPTLQENAIEYRHNTIVEYLRQNTATIKDLERVIGVGYYTLRTDLQILLAQGKVNTVGTGAKGAVIYSSKFNHLGRWPILWRNLGKSIGWNFKEAASKSRILGYGTPELVAHFRLLQELTLIMCRANDHKVDHPAKPTNSQLKDLRSNFRETLSKLEEDVFMLQNIANMDVFWTEEGLRSLASLPDFPRSSVFINMESGETDDLAKIFEKAILDMRAYHENKRSQPSNKEPDNEEERESPA